MAVDGDTAGADSMAAADSTAVAAAMVAAVDTASIFAGRAVSGTYR
jgi:hypothetical protein